MPVTTRPPARSTRRARSPGSLYAAALRTPGAARFFGAAVPGRVGIAMTILGLVWLVHQATGSFARAGVVVGAFAIAEATVGPLVAAVIDRHGQPRVLPVSAGAHLAALALLITASRLHLGLPVLVAAAVLGGSTIPQLGALTSARWAALLPEGPVLGAAFALESTSNGLAYLIGPALVATLAATTGPTAAALVAASSLALAAFRSTAPGPTAALPPTGGPHRTVTAPAASTRQLVTRGFLALVGVNLAIGVFFGSMAGRGDRLRSATPRRAGRRRPVRSDEHRQPARRPALRPPPLDAGPG